MASTLGVGALGANDHEVVDEHILTGVGVDEPGGLGVVHGALGSVMSTSTAAPARICSTRSPDALNCVSAKVVPVWSV